MSGGQCENRSLSELSFSNFSENAVGAVGCLRLVSTCEAPSCLLLCPVLFTMTMSLGAARVWACWRKTVVMWFHVQFAGNSCNVTSRKASPGLL